MEDLRSEIRAAFEREQAAHPPVANLRHSVVRAVTTQPRRHPNLQWIAVATAAVLAVLVVAGLMSTRLAHQPTPSHKQPVGDYGPPPAGVPLFYVQDPNHPGWYTGFDWTGKPRGTIKIESPLATNSGLAQAPDGSAFRVTLGGKGNGGFLDRLGQPVSDLQPVTPGAMWADDNRHLCAAPVGQKQMMTLQTQLVGEAPHTVATTIRYQGGESAIYLGACSFKNNRAVLVETAGYAPDQYWVVQLSDGTVLAHAGYHPPAALANLVVSSDATLLAENSAASVGTVTPNSPPTIVSRLLSQDWRRLAILDRSIGVLGFSSDDKLALVTTSPWISGAPTHLEVIDVATGRVLWRYDGGEYLAGFFTDPNGSGFAVMLQSPSDNRPHPAVDVVLVAGNGKATGISSRYLRP